MAITLVPATPAKAEFTASYHKRIAYSRHPSDVDSLAG
jgi:hypothetical protein